MRKPDKEVFKYVIYDQATAGVIFKENVQGYFNSVEEIIPILSKFNNKEDPNRYIARLANLADIKRSLKTGPGIYFIQTEYAGLIGADINKESKMSKEEKNYKFVIVDSHDKCVVFLPNSKPFFDTIEEINREVKILNSVGINPEAFVIRSASLESLKPYLTKGPGKYDIPTFQIGFINDFRNQEALSQQQAMERQQFMNNPFTPGPYFRQEFTNSLNNHPFLPSHFQPPQMPQMINKFGMSNIIPIIPNKEIVFNNHPDWKLIKKIGTDESGDKVIVEVLINNTRMIKIIDANEIVSKDVGSFFVVIFSTQNGDLMSINPSTFALKNMIFKTAYRLDYYDDGVFVISNPFTDVDTLITEMNKDMSDLHDFHNQLNTQTSTLIR